MVGEVDKFTFFTPRRGLRSSARIRWERPKESGEGRLKGDCWLRLEASVLPWITDCFLWLNGPYRKELLKEQVTEREGILPLYFLR